jgi:hypothetical protein
MLTTVALKHTTPYQVRITVNSYSRNGGKRTGNSAQTVQEFR